MDTATGQAAFNLTDYTWLPDGALLTSGKDGTVTFVPPGGSPRVIGHVPGVRANGDHGMLGFAAANDYATTGRVYITYDSGDPNGTGFGMVEEWAALPAASPTTFTKSRTLIDGSAMTPAFAQTTINHGVDEVTVAQDGTLFVSVGDDAMNNGGPNSLRAQDLDLPYGKILHLTADGDGVSTNPFYDAAAPHSWRSMVYAYGFRNPFRFSIDARNGLLQLGDVGWNQTEEVDTVAAGMNGGWPCYEGTRHPDAFKTQQACLSLYAAGTATPPIVTYEHAGSGASVTGGVQYNGAGYPMAYRGAWFYGDYARGMLWTLTTDETGHLQRAPETAGFGSNVGGPVAFQPGPGGDITYADISTGNVRRLVYATGNHAPSADIDFQVDPDTRTVSFSAAGSSDPDGDALTYSWNFGDGTSSTQAAPQHTFGDSAERTVTLTVRDVLGATSTTTALVNPGGHSPTLTLTLPTKKTFAVGDQVKLSAKATDPEDGDLVVHWTSALKHCPFTNSCHLHPEGAQTGATFTDTYPDHTFDTTLLVTATATDSDGSSTTKTYEAPPTLRTVKVSSPVAAAINGTPGTSAQVVQNSQVQLSAPASSTYRVFKSWSDGGAASHAFTMPARNLSLTATYQTAIDVRYAALGGATSFLGAAKNAEYNTPGITGRGRQYAGGRLYWGPTSGTHYLTGAVLTAFTGGGATAGFGLPTTDNTAVTGGDYAHFTGDRSIFHKTGKSAFRLVGQIRAYYASRGYQTSCLGFPTANQASTSAGLKQSFEHGTITFTTKTGKATATC